MSCFLLEVFEFISLLLQHLLLRLLVFMLSALEANKVSEDDEHVDHHHDHDDHDQRNTEERVIRVEDEVQGVKAAQEHCDLIELLQVERLFVRQWLLNN